MFFFALLLANELYLQGVAIKIMYIIDSAFEILMF